MSEAISSDWLRGGGEMGRRVREHGWAATPLGRLEKWPPPLRATLATMLSHPLPMALAWGPERTTFHNDAYLPLLGGKPDALGRPFLEVWAEARATIAPQVARALTGEASRFEDAGFDVLDAGSADEAVGVLQGGGAVAAVVTDVRMPGRMDGLDLARWLASSRPDTPVFITSGYVSPEQAMAANAAVAAVLGKPYLPEDVVALVRDRLFAES